MLNDETNRLMNMSNLKFTDIDEYHSCQPADIQKTLEQLRQTIKQAAPQATEAISYGMPAFRQNKVLVYYSVNKKQSKSDKVVCNLLSQEISNCLTKTENKIWHGHPVWFLDSNPIVGYSKQKAGIRLMFWSGASFDETGLEVRGKKFKDASVFYNAVSEINTKDLKRWLKKSKEIQWDYKNIVKRKGVLERLK